MASLVQLHGVRAALCSLAVMALLAACGGGGGGNGNADSPAPPSGSAKSGLVPAAPAPGEVLYADATALRPLREGAEWLYAGRADLDTARPAPYLNRVVTTASGGAFTERAENALNAGLDSQTLSVAAGTVTARILADVTGLPSGLTIDYTELRSPVRAGEQITLLDRVDEPVADVDGDRVNDKADIAVYSRVIGNETVELPDLGRSVQALRVDQTVLIKIKQSGNGQVLPVANSVQSVWYLSGVGIVRRTSTAVSMTTAVGVIDTDERLRRWDGVTEGLGVMGVTGATFPPAQAPIPGALVRTPLAAVGFGDRALVLTADWSGAESGENGVALVALDKRGAATSVQGYPQFKVPVNTRPALLRVGSEAVLALTENGPLITGVGPSFDLRLVRAASDARLTGTSTGVPVSLGAVGAVQAASDGSNLWLMWVRRDASDGFSSPGRLYLQRFDVNGTALASPILLDQLASGTYVSLGLSADKGRVLASWGAHLFPAPVYRYAVGSAAGVNIQTLGTASNLNQLATGSYVPFISGEAAMLSWQGPLFDATGATGATDRQLRGILLNAAGLPQRATTGSLDLELLPASLAMPQTTVLRTAGDGRLIFGSTATGLLFDGMADTPYVDIRWFTPSSGSLAQVAPVRLLGPSQAFGALYAVVSLDDRLLLLGARAGMTTMVAWLR